MRFTAGRLEPQGKGRSPPPTMAVSPLVQKAPDWGPRSSRADGICSVEEQHQCDAVGVALREGDQPSADGRAVTDRPADSGGP
jgi:hypothetical protein